MIIYWKNPIPIALLSLPETNITDEWLKLEINKCAFNLMEVGFKVCSVMTDDHPPNVSVFSRLHKVFDGYKRLFTALIVLIQHKHCNFLT